MFERPQQVISSSLAALSHLPCNVPVILEINMRSNPLQSEEETKPTVKPAAKKAAAKKEESSEEVSTAFSNACLQIPSFWACSYRVQCLQTVHPF